MVSQLHDGLLDGSLLRSVVKCRCRILEDPGSIILYIPWDCLQRPSPVLVKLNAYMHKFKSFRGDIETKIDLKVQLNINYSLTQSINQPVDFLSKIYYLDALGRFFQSRAEVRINRLPDKPILGSFNSTANKDMMAKIWTNGDRIICLSRKHCGKRRNCSLPAFSPFPTMFSKVVVFDVLKRVSME